MSAPHRTFVKPPSLRHGATLAVVSPASTAKRELIERGVRELEAEGYRIKLGKHVWGGGPLYYAGTAAQRLEDLHGAFGDDKVDGIVCTRGGWGSAELLPHLDVDLIRTNPKAFIGYSDHTSLHTWFQNEANLTTFYAPMVAADFARDHGVDLASWRNTFDGTAPWSFSAADGLRVLIPGLAEGNVLGGCISILVAGLGTPFAPRLEESILFLEDIGTKPYQWDRMLLHLRYSGRLDGVCGIVFGDMQQCVSQEEQGLLESAIIHGLRGFEGPVAIGLRCGHVDGPNRTVPLGVPARLNLTDAANPELTFLEPAVSS